MRGRAALLAGGALAGCAAPPVPVPTARPMRVVSLDYCADQYVLKLLDRRRILALSPDAARDFSYMRAAAGGVRQVSPRAEDVLVLRPDLVVRSYGGGADAAAMFARAGVPVLQLGYADSLAAVRADTIRIADALGAGARGRAVAAEMDRRLAALPPVAATRPTALYTTPGGVTSGGGTLVDEMLRTAGYANFQPGAGWPPLPLERLAYSAPAVVAAARFGSDDGARDRWTAARHPVLRARLRGRPVVPVEGAWTACGGWFLLDAVEALAKAR